MNYFQLFDLEAKSLIDSDLLKSRYQEKAKQQHPDQGGDEDAFQQLNKAYNTLKLPHERLKYLLKIHHISFFPRGSVSSHLLDSFMPISELSQTINQHIKSFSSSSSSLAKALLSSRSMELQEELEKWIATIETIETKTLDGLTTQAIDSSEFQVTIRDLAFIFKWKAELRELYSQLFSLT